MPTKPIEKHRKVAGLDLSLNCPAICVIDPYDSENINVPFDQCRWYYLTDNTSRVLDLPNIKGKLIEDYTSDQQRYETLAEWAVDILQREGIVSVGIEGYAYNAQTSSLTKLAESCGLLKYLLYTNGMSMDVYPPTQVKKIVTGNGLATKAQMLQAFINDTGVDMAAHIAPHFKIRGKKPAMKHIIDGSPSSDLVDAYYIGVLHRVEDTIGQMEYFPELDTPKEKNDA